MDAANAFAGSSPPCRLRRFRCRVRGDAASSELELEPLSEEPEQLASSSS